MLNAYALAAVPYLVGQLANFAFQLLLLQRLGAADYAQVGLAHLLLLSILFIADLGYASVFLRERSSSPGWARRWRLALGHRLLLSGGLGGIALLAWGLLRPGLDSGLAYLLGTLPALFFALINYSAPSLADGRRLLGVGLQQLAWPCALLAALGVPSGTPLHNAFGAAFCVSLGYFLQAVANLLASADLRLWLPSFAWREGRTMLLASCRIAAMGIAGTLHDRLTPFLLAPLLPAQMPLYLLLGHLLSGLAGVIAQLNRLFLVEARSDRALHRSLCLAGVMLFACVLALSAACAWRTLGLPGVSAADLALLLPTLLGWTLAAAGGPPSAVLLGRLREAALARRVLVGALASALVQLLGAWLHSAPLLLWGRALCLGLVFLATLRLCGSGFAAAAWLLLGAAGALAFVAHWAWSWPALLAILGFSAWRLLHDGAALFRPVRSVAEGVSPCVD